MDSDLHHDVGYIKGRVDLLVDMMKDSNDNQIKLGERVGNVEKNQSYQSGMVAGISAVFGVLGAYFQKHFSGS